MLPIIKLNKAKNNSANLGMAAMSKSSKRYAKCLGPLCLLSFIGGALILLFGKSVILLVEVGAVAMGLSAGFILGIAYEQKKSLD